MIIGFLTDFFGTLLTGLGLRSTDPNKKYKYYRVAIYAFTAAVIALFLALIIYPTSFSKDMENEPRLNGARVRAPINTGSLDFDGDGIYDHLDDDDDNDGQPDDVDLDDDNDGIPDDVDDDDDNDGIKDHLDGDNDDMDGDGIIDSEDNDDDNDGVPDDIDTDDDNDGIVDALDDDDDNDNNNNGNRDKFVPWGIKANKILHSIVCGQVPFDGFGLLSGGKEGEGGGSGGDNNNDASAAASQQQDRSGLTPSPW